MLDWLTPPRGDEIAAAFPTADQIVLRLLLALALGGVVAGVYVLSRRRPLAETGPFLTTLVLLSVLIAMVTLIIGDSTARAFSLVGALAIVRFRTVVEDTRDTAFVIFAVVVGMGVGADLLVVPLVGIPVVTIGALLLSWLTQARVGVAEYTLALRVGLGRDPAALFRETFDKHLAASRLTSMMTARQGAALDLTYRVQLRREDEAVTLVNELNQVEGVQSVELRQV